MRQVLAAGPVVAAVALIVGVGYAHGVFTNRWGLSGQLEAARAAVDRVPTRFGDWAAVDAPSKPIEDDALKLGGIKGYVQRDFVNERTGERVFVLIVCGRGGPISAHTPEDCYPGAGFTRATETRRREVAAGGGTHGFQAVRFNVPDRLSKGLLEIFWGWSADGRGWDAPKDPRAAYARLPALYKMYVIREVPTTSQGDVGDPGRDFLAAALPALGDALAMPAGE